MVESPWEPDYDTGNGEMKSETVSARVRKWGVLESQPTEGEQLLIDGTGVHSVAA